MKIETTLRSQGMTWSSTKSKRGRFMYSKNERTAGTFRVRSKIPNSIMTIETSHMTMV